jgi:hypothetical protein
MMTNFQAGENPMTLAVNTLADERDVLRAEVERLQAALRTFAVHLDCAVPHGDCTCGLNAFFSTPSGAPTS